MLKTKQLVSTLLALLLFAMPALAVRTTVTPLTPVSVKGSISANAADITWTAVDVSNGNRFVPSGRDLILFYNSHASNAYTCTVTSAADELGRTLDVTYTLQAGEVGCFGPYQQLGWRQSDGYVYITGENAAMKVCIIRLPY